MNLETFALISAQLSGLDYLSNRLRTQELYKELYWMPFIIRRVQGRWQDFVEETFQVFKPEAYSFDEFVTDTQALAQRFDQECILVCHRGDCDLFWPDGNREYLGIWRPVPAGVAMRTLDGWTRIGEEYFYVA